MKITTRCLAVFISLFFLQTLHAQEEQKDVAFFTGTSPVIIEKGTAEINLNNTLTSFWVTSKQYIPSVDAYRVVDRRRFSRLDNLLRVTYGFSQSKKWDLGAELRFANTRLDESARSSPLRVFGGESETGKTYHEFAYAGLRARASLFKNIPELTLQTTITYPMSRIINDRPTWLEPLQTQLGLGATYFAQSGSNTIFFFQTDWTTRFRANSDNGTVPMAHIISASTYMVINLWEQNWYIFPSLAYGSANRIEKGNFRRLNQQLLGGIGLYFQPSSRFSILLNGNFPLVLQTGSDLSTFNKETYTGITISLRTLLE